MAYPPSQLCVIVARGAHTVVAAVRASGKCLVEEFLTELDAVKVGNLRPRATARDRCLELFAEMAEKGEVSPKRFKFEGDHFWAFRFEINNVQYRFPCFQDGDRWVITHGFKKPGAQKKRGKWPPEQVKRAQDIRSEYLQKKTRQKR